MITSSRLKILLVVAAVVAFHATSYAQTVGYEWLKTPKYKTIFVLTDFKECKFLASRLDRIVKSTFSHSNIKATLSKSLVFKATGKDKNSVYELLDSGLIHDNNTLNNKLIENNKIILHVYGKCVEYGSGFIYQFDVNFGVYNKKYSQALLYATPQHSVIGVDTSMGIDRAFSKLMQNVVDDYVSANQPAEKK